MRRKLLFTLAVTLQIAVLLVMMGMKSYTLAYGAKILLKTEPVDPWDLFRGDYVTLNYEISRLDLKSVAAGGERFKRNDTVYVTLKQQGKYWTATAISHRRPENSSLAMKGTVMYETGPDNTIAVNYGIDSYYVPQYEGRDIERNRKSLDVEVSVDRWGNSALARLFFEGKEVRFK